MPPLEVQDKMFVDVAAFRATVHGEGPCTRCHAGQGDATEKDAAHQGLVADPSADPDQICGPCHPEVARTAVTSLHYTFRGLEETFRIRGSEASQASLQQANRELCGQCHGEKLRDWKVGVHGKRIGYWNGKKEYLLCVHCHNPHSPRFKELTPEPPPVRQEDIE